MNANPAISILPWGDEANALIARANPKLAETMTQLSPDQSYQVVVIDFAFGDLIFDQHGQLQLSEQHATQHELDKAVALIGKQHPVGILTKGVAEFFVANKQRVIPFKLLQAGNIIGSWGKFDDDSTAHAPLLNLQLSAGARSLVMLPKVSDELSHRRLQKACGIKTDKPRTLADNWAVFRDLAQAPQVGQSNWRCQIIFFSQHWFAHYDDPSWSAFYNYLLVDAWQQTQFWRNQFVWDLLFDTIHSKKRLQANGCIRDLAKHALSVAVGALPGFVPASDDSAGPIALFQQVYRDVYDLKQYPPLIMQPSNFDYQQPDSSVLLSLQFPTSVQYTPRLSHRISMIADLDATQNLISNYLSALQQEELQAASARLLEVPKAVAFDFYHSNTGNYKNIKSSALLENDSAFADVRAASAEAEKFPFESSFFKGCIALHSRKADDCQT